MNLKRLVLDVVSNGRLIALRLAALIYYAGHAEPHDKK
jgi:hypothetical protein